MLSPENKKKLDRFIQQIRRRQVVGSYDCARQTADLLRDILGTSNWRTAQDVLNLLREIGPTLAKANPAEFCVGNIVRRCLYLVREEHLACYKEEMSHSGSELLDHIQTPSLQGNVMLGAENTIDFTVPLTQFKSALMVAMNGLVAEIDGIHRLISPQSLNYIHNDEVIMTHGRSSTVEEFLKAAHRKGRVFKVIVVETAPLLTGHDMAVNLAKEGISTTLITDSAIFAIMARVNKVIIGTHAVMANGGLIAHSGTNLLAQSAKYYNVPFIVTAGTFKLCPLYSFDHHTYNEIVSPDAFIPFHEAETFRSVHAENPLFDYIQPDLVSLLITNLVAYSPSYMYRLLQDHYNIQDTLE